MAYLTDDPTISHDIQWLLANDPRFQDMLGADFVLQREAGIGGITGLIRIVIGQQVSTKAADSLWTKFTNRFDPTDISALLRASDDDLRACGLSRQKITYIRGLAQAVDHGDINIASWDDKPSADVISDITALKGFGLWSAHMYLMFHLRRPDIWPYGDLGIQIGLGHYLQLDARPTDKDTKANAHLFKGRETAASLLLWSVKDGGI